MRHRVYGKHLGRTRNSRIALFKNLVQSLILSEKIETTEAKAKAVKALVDQIITAAKSPSTQRQVNQFFNQKTTQEKLINDLVPRLSGRTSGYTSITKIGRRLGDGSMIVQMRLLTEEKKVTKKEVKETKEKEVKKTTKKA